VRYEIDLLPIEEELKGSDATTVWRGSGCRCRRVQIAAGGA